MKTLTLVLFLFGVITLGIAAEPAPADNDVQDVVYMGESRPAFLRLHVRDSNGSAFTRFDALMERLFKFIDRDNSGSLNRNEADRIPTVTRLNQFLTGNPYITDNRRPGTASSTISIEEVDTDRDGQITLGELKDYYRNKGISALVMFNQTTPVGIASVTNDAVFDLLDLNKDGKLSRTELLSAHAELIRLDQDDDELLSAAELNGTSGGTFGRGVTAGGGAMMPARTPAVPRISLEYLPRDDRRLSAKMDVARKIIEKYDTNKDGRLTLAEIGFSKDSFSKLDRNRDSKLDSLELARWLMGTPELEYTVRFTAAQAMMQPRGLATSERATSENTLTMGNVQLSIFGQPSAVDYSSNYKTQLLNQFNSLDTEKTGFLTRKQLEPQTAFLMRNFLDIADRNGDNRLTREELSDYLDLVAFASQSQVSLTLSTTGQGLYQALDTNADGFLSIRELRNSWTRLSAFDTDGDGAISRSELPAQVRLLVGQGGTQRFGGAFPLTPLGGRMGTSGRPVPTRGPLWFRKMDRNGDGDVSRTEWLGSPEDFERADTDKDGLIGLQEAEAFDAARRK